jgi:hypothetical protein
MQTKKKVKTNQKIAPVVPDQEPEETEAPAPEPKFSVELVPNDGTKTQDEKNRDVI